jgi:hypothetical protein
MTEAQAFAELAAHGWSNGQSTMIHLNDLDQAAAG